MEEERREQKEGEEENAEDDASAIYTENIYSSRITE